MDTLSRVAWEAGLIGRRAKKLLSGNDSRYLFSELGLQIDSATYASPAYQTLRAALTGASTVVDSLVQAAQAVTNLLATPAPDPMQLLDAIEIVYDACDRLLTEFIAIKNALAALSTTPVGTSSQTLANFAQRFADALTQYLLIGHLQGFHSQLFGVLKLLGVVRNRVAPTLNGQTLATADQVVQWSALTDLLRSPATYLTTTYGWGTPNFAYRLFLSNLEYALRGLGIPAYFSPSQYELAQVPVLYLNSFLGIQPAADSSYAFDAVLTAPALAQSLLLPITLAGWEFEVGSTADVTTGSSFRINWNGSIQATLANAAAAVSLTVIARLPVNSNGQAHQLLTTPFGVGVSTQAIELKATFSTPIAAAANTRSGEGTMAFSVEFTGFNVKIEPGEADSFIGKLLGTNPVNLKSDLAIDWTKGHGLTIRGGQGLLPRKTTNFTIGPVNVGSVALGLLPEDESVSAVALLSATALLGPIEVAIADLGFRAQLEYGAGNLGPFGVALGFKAPAGIGIRINSDAVSGGGYLSLDQANGSYAGVAGLTVREKLKLNAIGLLQTRLPNNRPGYSFLLLITAEFTPLQLGLGFTLNGVGGLVGLNRTASTNVLRGLVQNGQINTLLFPASVLSNPQTAVATVDSAFPAAEGRYVFGIMAKIGWGSPNLLTLEAALIIELPAPVRLILLGVLRATLPNESSAIVRLRADFVGIVDFGAKKVAFDAVLVDSRILQFPLTGNFSFRLYQGDNPVFLMTAGGFHPAFTPPANADLPTLRRLTLALAQGGDFRLMLSSYLAITSNTVQFGSRLDLYVNLGASFTLEGFFGFDALFQFNPFRLQVRVGAGVAIKRSGRSVLSLSLDLQVSGPAPWHVQGTGSFRVLFIRVSFRIDRTFGGGVAQPALPSTNIRQLLTAALADKANWEVIQPAVKPANTVVLRTEDHPSELVVDPGGALAVRQKVVPFDYLVELYGNTTPTNGNQFRVTGVKLGEGSNELVLVLNQLGELRDAFAPGQLRRMSDAQKLSAPSFQFMRSGLQLNTIDGLTGQGGETREQVYEQRIFEPVTTGTGGSGTSNRAAVDTTANDGFAQESFAQENAIATDDTTVITSVEPSFSSWTSKEFISSDSTVMPALNATRLARTGAIGRTSRSYEQQRPSRLAPDKVGWSEDSYAIVSTRDLQLDALTPTPFRTEAEATSYLTQRLADDPELVGELQVLPVYQLDVSTPSTSANLVTA